MAIQDVVQARVLLDFCLSRYPSDLYFVFYDLVLKGLVIKHQQQQLLKEALDVYLKRDDQLIHRENFIDAQLLLLALAKIYQLNGEQDRYQTLLEVIEDQEVLRFVNIW